MSTDRANDTKQKPNVHVRLSGARSHLCACTQPWPCPKADDTGHYPVSYSDEDPLRPIRCNCGDGWPCTRNEPTSEAPTSPPCRSVLMIGGADFPCDWPTDDRGKHPGWAHANKNCQAIWGKGNKPNTTLYDGQARERAERRNCTCPPGGIDPECHGPAEASSQATTYELAYGRGYEDGVEQEKANQVGTLTLPGEGSEVLVDGTRYRVHLEPITTGKTVVVEEPRFRHQTPGHGKWWQLMHADHHRTGPVFSCPFCHPKRSLVEAVEVHRAWCAEHDIEPDTLRKLTEDRHDVIIGVRRNAVLAEQVAQASAEELNAELARRGWKLAFDLTESSARWAIEHDAQEAKKIDVTGGDEPDWKARYEQAVIDHHDYDRGYREGRESGDLQREHAIAALCEAIRLTVEYVGTETLHPLPGWAWYDALTTYAPDTVSSFQASPWLPSDADLDAIRADLKASRAEGGKVFLNHPATVYLPGRGYFAVESNVWNVATQESTVTLGQRLEFPGQDCPSFGCGLAKGHESMHMSGGLAEQIDRQREKNARAFTDEDR